MGRLVKVEHLCKNYIRSEVRAGAGEGCWEVHGKVGHRVDKEVKNRRLN
jgi:hypothetical protein